MLQECDHKVKEVLLERDELQVRLDSTASQLSEVRESLTTAREQLEQHCGHSTNTHLWLESSLSSTASGFVDRVSGSVSDEVPDHRARLTDVVVLAFDRLELDWQSIVEPLCAAEHGVSVSTANPAISRAPFFMPLVPINE